MKKLFSFACGMLLSGLFASAQPDTSAWQVKAGDVMSYHVSSNGQEYNFVVKVNQLNSLSPDPIQFDWNMSAPVNRSGTIKISATAATESNSFYNFFSGGEKQLNYETSVFISDDLDKLLRVVSKGTTVKIKAHGAAFGEQDFTVEDDAEDFSFVQNGEKTTVKVVALKDMSSGDQLKIYCSPQNAFIVSMSIGFDILLSSVSSK